MSASKPALGEKKILYIRVNYSDDPAEPITMSEAETLMAEVDDFFRSHSYGKCWTRATITPLIQMPQPKAEYFVTNATTGDFVWYAFDLLNDARDAARAAGFDASDYDTFLVRFNAPLWQSRGNLGFPGAWMVNSQPATTVHEIGHNIGLHHANAWDDLLQTSQEYGDPFDIMGNPHYYELAGFNTINKTTLGWLDESNAARVTASGIYRLYAHDTNVLAADRRYLLRIPKDDARDYWIEKRQSFNHSDDLEYSGVLAYWDEWEQSEGRTFLLDPIPGPGWAIPINDAILDAASGVRVIPLRQSEDRSYVDVAVILGHSTSNIVPGLLHFAGTPSQIYLVQSSDDLRRWTDLQQTSSETGELIVPINHDSPHRFYRVVAMPQRK